MQRKSNDLLELFRPRASASAPAKGSRASRAAGVGVTLERRHLVLAASGTLLVVALAFVGGIAVGRSRKAGTGRDVPLARLANVTWRIPSKPLARLGAGGEDAVARAEAALLLKYPQLVGHTRIEPVKGATGRGDGERPRARIVLTGFPDRRSAEDWAVVLSGFYEGDAIPFFAATVEPDAD